MKMTLRERIFNILCDYAGELYAGNREEALEAILKAVEEVIPKEEKPDDSLCECAYLQCHCGGWNACLEAVRKRVRCEENQV